MAKDPKTILKILSGNNGRINDLYRYLYIPEFYQIAYNNIYSKPSQMTPASDGSTIDGMSMERINKLIQSLRDRSYQPTPLRRVQIPKKSGGTRPISIPSFEDKLVQEIIRMILEALYDHTFLECSHGFRPNRSCHTALDYVKRKFQGTKWWIDCDIKGCFDNINHQKLIQILAERIKEQKFLSLINKFLKAGYIENWQYHKTYSGTPQGSIISPILANIYLDKLDRFIIDIKNKVDIGTTRKADEKYIKLSKRHQRTAARIRKGINVEENKIRHNIQLKETRKYTSKHGTLDFMDPNFKRLQYVRYADDFIIGIIGTKEETKIILNLIEEFTKDKLYLNLNLNKTKIVHNGKLIRFLGYDISVMKSKSRKTVNGGIALYLPYEKAVNFIISNKFGKFETNPKSGKPMLKAIHLNTAINDDELEILNIFNTKLRGFYHYYKLASNVYKLVGFGYITRLSFLRTLAAKYKSSCAKLLANKNYKQKINGINNIGITYKNKFYELFTGPFEVDKSVSSNYKIDIIENINKYFDNTGLIKRLEAKECEYCHNTNGPFEVHHIKKLKNLKGKSAWEKHMIARRRKTIVLCKECHDKLHAGKL